MTGPVAVRVDDRIARHRTVRVVEVRGDDADEPRVLVIEDMAE